MNLIGHTYIPVGIFIGALISKNEAENVFMGVLSVVGSIAVFRLYYFIRNQNEILRFINRIGVHEYHSMEDAIPAENKINFLIKFATIFSTAGLTGIVSMIVMALPIFTTEKRIPFNLFIPYLDWRNNELHYWISFAYVSYETKPFRLRRTVPSFGI